MLWFIWGALIALSGCREEEDPIVPSGDYTPIRFEFPQGNDSWDQEIQKIYNEYGVCLIYKDYTENDLNKTWALGLPFTYMGDVITPERVPMYVNYVRDHILTFMNKRWIELYFPQYIYFTDDMGMYMGDMLLMNSSNKLDGMDFWCISFWKDAVFYRDDANMTYTICYKVYSQAVREGWIEEPVGFSEGIDYKTDVVTEEEKESDPNYYLNRGFVDYLDDYFNLYGAESFDIWYVTGKNADFLCYLRMAMYLPEEQFKEKYPVDKYPLINKRYEMVVNLFKTAYGVDLKAFARSTQGLVVKP